jgi:hypothetical protein
MDDIQPGVATNMASNVLALLSTSPTSPTTSRRTRVHQAFDGVLFVFGMACVYSFETGVFVTVGGGKRRQGGNRGKGERRRQTE